MSQKTDIQKEGRLQAICFLSHWNHYPQFRGRLFAINNNSLNAIQGAQNKAKGVVKGTADMCYLRPEKGLLFMEFKLPGQKQSKKQVIFEKIVRSDGHDYAVIYTEDQFWEAVKLQKPRGGPFKTI